MTGRVVVAFFLGALSHQAVQFIVAAAFEIPESADLVLERFTADQKGDYADGFRLKKTEEGGPLIGDDYHTLMARVPASKNTEWVAESGFDISVVNHSEASPIFRSSTDVQTSHIGEVSLVDSVDSVNPIVTHLTPPDIVFQAHIGTSISDIDENVGQDIITLRIIGDRLEVGP